MDARVLHVATDLFLAHGFSGVTLDRVAADAGVTKRTLSVSVGDKRELLRAVVRRQHTYAGAPTGDLESTAARIARALLTDRAVALHRLLIAEAGRNPELAREFHEAGPLAAQAALVRAGATPETAAELFTLLLGELHRERLLGLAPEPTADQIAARASRAVALLST